MQFSTDPFDCTATFEVPLPDVTDNCSDWTVLTEVVDLDGNEITIYPNPAAESVNIESNNIECTDAEYLAIIDTILT